MKPVACPPCRGTGSGPCARCHGAGIWPLCTDDACPDCSGEGLATCLTCDGEGVVVAAVADCERCGQPSADSAPRRDLAARLFVAARTAGTAANDPTLCGACHRTLGRALRPFAWRPARRGEP